MLGRLLSEDGPDSVQFESEIQPAAGGSILCEDHMGVLPYEGDSFNGSVGVLRDISDRKTREERLQEKNTRLEAFTSVVSHDLRNPLNVAEGHLQLVQQEYESDHLDAVERAHRRMHALIEDLLALARADKAAVTTAPVELEEVIEQSWATVETADASLVSDIRQMVEAENSRLRQLLENLIRNAIEHGGSDVTITIGPVADGFYLADDGPGIPDAQRDAIFDAGYSTNDSGTGFGLTIVKQVVDAHGWTLRVTDSTDSGARFEIGGIETTAEADGIQ